METNGKHIIILFVMIIVIFSCLYSLFVFLKWNSIINEFKKMPSIIAKLDKRFRYKGDYYISIDSTENDHQHIHIALKQTFGFCYGIVYIFKKYGNHYSNVYEVNIYDLNTDTICSQLISDFKKFI